MERKNIFYEIVDNLSRRGEDMENVAAEMAKALVIVMKEGAGENINLCEEFTRLHSTVLVEAPK